MGQFIVKALICAVYCQKASVCKHAVIQPQSCLWGSALNQMASYSVAMWGRRRAQDKTVLKSWLYLSKCNSDQSMHCFELHRNKQLNLMLFQPPYQYRELRQILFRVLSTVILSTIIKKVFEITSFPFIAVCILFQATARTAVSMTSLSNVLSTMWFEEACCTEDLDTWNYWL